VLVLENDIERQVLAGDGKLSRRRDDEANARAGPGLDARIANNGALDLDLAFPDQLLQPSAREAEPVGFSPRRQSAIQA
jgi:hypothetical protein